MTHNRINSFYFSYFFSTFNYLLWACCYAFSFYFLYFEVRSCFYETRFKQFTVLLSFSLLSILIFLLLLILSLIRQIHFWWHVWPLISALTKIGYSQIFLHLLFFVRVDISIFICLLMFLFVIVIVSFFFDHKCIYFLVYFVCAF